MIEGRKESRKKTKERGRNKLSEEEHKIRHTGKSNEKKESWR